MSRIPHTIPRNTFQAYKPSDVTLNLVGEDQRLIKAEDQTWDVKLFPSLASLCVDKLVSLFKDRPVLDLPAESRDLLLELLPTDLPPSLTIPLIEDGIYWQRSALDRWNNVNYVKDYGGSWKRLFVERYLQDELETLPVEDFDKEEVTKLLSLCAPYVERLRLSQLRVARLRPKQEGFEECSVEPEPMHHIDLQLIIGALYELKELDIVFGERNCGMDFKWSLFKFAVTDCIRIGAGIELLEKLTILRIHRSTLDDVRVAALLQKLANNTTLQELDFSHCWIGDSGAMAIGKLLTVHPTLKIVNLLNNRIGSKGAEGLAFALSKASQCPLQSLSLRLNSGIGDAGTEALCAALSTVNDGNLSELNLAGCDLGTDGAISISRMLAKNRSLRILDLSNNHLSEKGGKALETGIKLNQVILQLDLRGTEITQDNEFNISLHLQANNTLYKKQQQKLLRVSKSEDK